MATLYQAASQGDVDAVRRLLDEGEPADAPGEYDQTPLMAAAAEGHTEIVRMLLAAGANARRQNSLALDFAVRLGEPETVRVLLNAGADPNRSDPDPPMDNASEAELEDTELDDAEDDDAEDDDDEQLSDDDNPPVFDAVHRGNLEIVKMLVDAGARVDGLFQGYGLLAAAIMQKNAALFEFLWEQKARFEGALQAVAQSGNLEHLERLLAAGADIDECGVEDPPLLTAASCGRTAMVQRLISAGAQLEARGQFGNTALGEAVSNGQFDCARVLLENGAHLDACADSSIVAAAIWAQRTATLRLLLEHGADPNEAHGDHPAPLFLAISAGKPKMVQALLEHGADPNARRQKRHRQGDGVTMPVGATPLMFAAKKRQRQSIEWLLAAGADASLTDAKGRSAADYAAKAGDPKLTELFAQAGAKLHLGPRAQHNAALLAATRAGDVSGALAALEAGAEPSAADKDGCCALTHAAKRGMLALVERLISAGADPNRVSKYSESPLRVACLRQNAEVVSALLAGGADVNARQVPGSIPTDKPNTVYFSGESAVHDAAVWSTLEILKLLIEAGADINFAGASNQTPLVAAVNNRRMDSAEALLAAGAVVRPEDEIWIAPYRFARNAENPAFQAFVAEVVAACGATDEVLPHLPGARSFKLTLEEQPAPETPADRVQAAREWGKNFARDYAALNDKADAVIDRLAARGREAGFLLLDAGKPIGCGPMVQYIVVLPTADKFEAMAAFGVRGNDDELSTADIICWFRELDGEAPFHLRGVKFDTIQIEFLQPVENSKEMAQRMCDICSDLAAGADGDRVQAMAEWLQSNRRIHFWWD